MLPIAEIITHSVSGEESIQLLITMDSKEAVGEIHKPSLQNIRFTAKDNQLVLSLNAMELYEPFKSWVEKVDEDLAKSCAASEFVKILNFAIKSLVLLGKEVSSISIASIRGLYGELHVFSELLNTEQVSAITLLAGWHRPSPAIRDFSFEDRDIEVKTRTRTSQTIEISSEFQLENHGSRSLELRVVTIDHIAKSGTDSLGTLYSQILENLPLGLKKTFEDKCLEDAFFPYPGPDFMPLTYKLNVIEDMSFDAGKQGFPKIEKSHLPEGISGVTYKIDVSRLSDYKL